MDGAAEAAADGANEDVDVPVPAPDDASGNQPVVGVGPTHAATPAAIKPPPAARSIARRESAS
jgi:hypothetical protein